MKPKGGTNGIFKKTERKNSKKRLDCILNIAKNIINSSEAAASSVHPIYRYINAIGSPVLYNLLMQLILGQEVDKVDTVLYDLCWYIKRSNNNFTYDHFEVEDNKNINISLKDDLIIPAAWNIDRFETNITGIGSDCGNPFTFQVTNHMSILFLPIGISIVINGNHSILIGVLKREGIIHPTEILDLTKLYEKIKFDGTYYREIDGNKIIHQVKYFEMGAIFEIGRMLAQNNINFIEIQKG